MLYHLRTISNVEVVGELIENGHDRIKLKNPLIVERVNQDNGEYYSFTTYIPFQLSTEFRFENDTILTKTEVESKAYEMYYYVNLGAIATRIELMDNNVEERLAERSKSLH